MGWDIGSSLNTELDVLEPLHITIVPPVPPVPGTPGVPVYQCSAGRVGVEGRGFNEDHTRVRLKHCTTSSLSPSHRPHTGSARKSSSTLFSPLRWNHTPLPSFHPLKFYHTAPDCTSAQAYHSNVRSDQIRSDQISVCQPLAPSKAGAVAQHDLSFPHCQGGTDRSGLITFHHLEIRNMRSGETYTVQSGTVWSSQVHSV